MIDRLQDAIDAGQGQSGVFSDVVMVMDCVSMTLSYTG